MPCKICKVASSWPGLDKCANCWEVERRIDQFISSEGGRAIVLSAMKPFVNDMAIAVAKAGFTVAPPQK